MDWADNGEQAAFRAQVREVLERGLPDYCKNHSGGSEEAGGWNADRKSDNPVRREAARTWANVLAERGWFAPHWPKEYGGGGLSPMEQFIYKQEIALAEVPVVGGSGVSLLGPTLIVHGTSRRSDTSPASSRAKWSSRRGTQNRVPVLTWRRFRRARSAMGTSSW